MNDGARKNMKINYHNCHYLPCHPELWVATFRWFEPPD
jgi:hypothetical protein